MYAKASFYNEQLDLDLIWAFPKLLIISFDIELF